MSPLEAKDCNADNFVKNDDFSESYISFTVILGFPLFSSTTSPILNSINTPYFFL